MYKKDIMGGNILIIEKGDKTKSGIATRDLFIISGGMKPVFIDGFALRALACGQNDEKIQKVLDRMLVE